MRPTPLHKSPDDRRVRPAARLSVVVVLLSGVLCVCAAHGALADPRFGDSTWVAPAEPVSASPQGDGPRVAPRDHERRWETVLRTPFRVAFFPLRVVSLGFQGVAAWAGPRYFDPKPPRPARSGPVFSPRFMVGGVNDVGGGPGVKWAGFPSTSDRFDASASISTRDRRKARIREIMGDKRPVGFRLLADYDYEPDHKYFGIGNEASKDDLSYYLLATSRVEGTLLFGSSPLKQVRLVGGYSSMSPRRGYFGTPLLEDTFTPSEVPFEHRTTREFTYGVTGDLASVDDVRDPSRGAHARWDLRRANGQGANDPDYDQWRVEARAYVPVFAKRRVLAFRAVYAGVDPRGSTTTLPYYRLVTNEDANVFAAYSSERFRDRQLLLGRIEYRWMILYRISAVALYELGEVAPRASAFSLPASHRSIGGGLRFGISDIAVARLEVARSSEGFHARAAVSGDF